MYQSPKTFFISIFNQISIAVFWTYSMQKCTDEANDVYEVHTKKRDNSVRQQTGVQLRCTKWWILIVLWDKFLFLMTVLFPSAAWSIKYEVVRRKGKHLHRGVNTLFCKLFNLSLSLSCSNIVVTNLLICCHDMKAPAVMERWKERKWRWSDCA